jgi:uncharacterized protein (TIGR02611 family)
MRRQVKRVGIFVVGWALIIAGLAGIVLPILPGWVLIFLGLALLAQEFEWAERRQHQLTATYHAKKEQMLRHHRERVLARHATGTVETAEVTDTVVTESVEPVPAAEVEPARLRAPLDG